MQYVIVIKIGTSVTYYGPYDYDEAIKFGMVMLQSGSSVTMSPLYKSN